MTREALDELAAKLRQTYGADLERRKIGWGIASRRRIRPRGVRVAVVLEVMPEAGFDNWEWIACERRWFGAPTSLMSEAELFSAASAVLSRYASGDTPPFEDP